MAPVAAIKLEMELLLKCLDDIDDLFATLAQQFRPIFATVMLAILFVAAAGAILFVAPTDLLAAP
jgi:hypothetical protein